MGGRAVFERQQSPPPSSESRAVAKPERGASQPRRPGNPLLVQQRVLGNQAVQRLLLAGTLQAKLRVGRPNDPYEQEADRVADTVMRVPEPEVRRQREGEAGGIRTEPLANTITPVVQRQTKSLPEREEDEEPLRAEPAAGHEEEPRGVQRKAKGPGITLVHDAALARRLISPDGGAPLPGNTRKFFERRFGYDFSEVRVHDAHRDGADASTLNARAFTYRTHIWLGHGESVGDGRLMAHELTHVVQQGAGVRRQPLVSGSVAPRIQGSWWDSVTEFAGGVISSIGELAGAVKDRVLGQLAQWARRIPGFDLLTVILGRDPISDQPVERNAINLIRGVLGLVPGGTTMFDNLQRAGAIERAFEWFNGEIAKLNLTWEVIKGLFRTAWDSLSISDILDPANAIARVARIFAPPLARLRDFALAAGQKVLELVFEGVLSLAGRFGTTVLGIIRRAGGLITTIINNPIGFLGNLITALRGGFERFSANILAHLRTGLLEWLFGALSGAGLTLPDRFDLRGIISIVLQVLGLTYARLRARLVDLIGDRNVAFIEGVFDFLMTIVTGGLGAAWEKIVEFAGNLQETVIGGIRDWVARTIVGRAIAQLVTMFNPVGAVIQGIMTIYNTVVFFIERAQQIAALAEAVFDSIANIAAGNLGAAINYVERTMARTLPVIISFLARLIGLGGISERIKDIIKRIQAPIDRAIDRIASFIVERGRRLLAGQQAEVGAPEGPDPRSEAQKRSDLNAAIEESQRLVARPVPLRVVAAALPSIQQRYRLTSLRIVTDSSGISQVEGIVNPVAQTTAQRLLTPDEQGALERAATSLAEELNRGNDEHARAKRMRFHANPHLYVEKFGLAGRAVEAIGEQTVQSYARDRGLSLWPASDIETYKSDGLPVPGTRSVAELDGLLLRSNTVVGVVSAKLQYGSALDSADRTQISNSLDRYYFNRRIYPWDLESSRAFVSGGSVDARGARIVRAAGRTPILDLNVFQHSYVRAPVLEYVGITGARDPATEGPRPHEILNIRGLTRQQLLDLTVEALRPKVRS